MSGHQTLLPAAFLDRDGVINEERRYVHRIEDFVLLPGTLESMARLSRAGFLIVIVTNQAGIGRGYYSEADFQRLMGHFDRLARAGGVRIAGVYHCPHHPQAGVGAYRTACECRKPAPGLLLKAARDLTIDLTASVMIGDKGSDIAAARAAGVGKALLVTSGHPLDPEASGLADAVLPNLSAAVSWVLGDA
jgi:D-glycero-D-manno-heptose 1,7-bisphosphate phosphatase